jgi:hypothetical protein
VAIAVESETERRSLEALADELTLLSARQAAGEAEFLRVLEEFDRREGWAQWRLVSCAHWLNWRCGIDLGAARERVRVARRLRELPAIRSALTAGEVSYSKVRAMTRSATPANEETLLGYARHGTASHVEKIVRGYRSIAPDPTNGRLPKDVGDTPEATEYQGRLRHWYNAAGRLVLQIELPAEDGALALQALRAAVAAGEADPDEVDACCGADVSAETPDDPSTSTAKSPAPTAAGADVSAETSIRSAKAAQDVAKLTLSTNDPRRRAGSRTPSS